MNNVFFNPNEVANKFEEMCKKHPNHVIEIKIVSRHDEIGSLQLDSQIFPIIQCDFVGKHDRGNIKFCSKCSNAALLFGNELQNYMEERKHISLKFCNFSYPNRMCRIENEASDVILGENESGMIVGMVRFVTPQNLLKNLYVMFNSNDPARDSDGWEALFVDDNIVDIFSNVVECIS